MREEKARRVELSDRQRKVLDGWVQPGSASPEHLVERAQIVLLSADRVDDVGHAEVLGVNWQRVRRWRERWEVASEQLAALERADTAGGDAVLAMEISAVLDNVQVEKKFRPAADVRLTDRERTLLEKWVRNAASTPHRHLERCRIVLMSADGVTHAEQARRLGVDRQRVRRWRANWADSDARLLRVSPSTSHRPSASPPTWA